MIKKQYIKGILQMDNGYIFILQYVKNLEDQVLADNYEIGKELLKNKETFDSLIEKLYVSKLAQRRLVSDYEKAISSIPDQKYNVEWMKGFGKEQHNRENYA